MVNSPIELSAYTMEFPGAGAWEDDEGVGVDEEVGFKIEEISPRTISAEGRWSGS